MAGDYVHLNAVRRKLLGAEEWLLAYPWRPDRSGSSAARLRQEPTLPVKEMAECCVGAAVLPMNRKK